MSDEMTELPCPFCGGEAHIVNDYSSECDETRWNLWHECNGHEGKSNGYGYSFHPWFETPWYKTEAEAIAAWNTRAEAWSNGMKDLLLKTFGLAQMMHDCWLEECKAGDNVDMSACNAYAYEFDQVAQAMFDAGIDPNDSAYYQSAELNTRAERTCEPKWILQGTTQTQEFWRCDCGNCGECFGVEDRSSFPFKMTIDKVEAPNYCPNCGCKVIGG